MAAIARIVEGRAIFSTMTHFVPENPPKMFIFSNFFRSLVLTVVLSFIAPLFLVGGALLLLSLIVHLPGSQGIIEHILTQIMHFLATFGSGSSLYGLLIIGLTCSFVGALFDIYAYCRYYILRVDS